MDIAGRLPTIDEAKAFLADKDPTKREKWIARLLDSPEYAENFAIFTTVEQTKINIAVRP